jgi:predicted O-methyltransferase YrrM
VNYAKLGAVSRATGRTPAAVLRIQNDADAQGFTMASDPHTGALLAVLAASKPSGRFLELGTGTGLGAAWLLAGMDASSHLDSVDTDPRVVDVARRHLGSDPRLTLHVMDGSDFITGSTSGSWDFIYADAWPGKFTHLPQALALLRVGGMYFIDDLLPQPNWPQGHALKVEVLMDALARPDFITVRLDWASGLMIVVRQS